MRTSKSTSRPRLGTSTGASSGVRVSGAAAAASVDAAGAATPMVAPTGTAAPLQSAVMGPALAAMAEMPEIDHARVAELRDAIARGELTFDAGKLAGLIQKFHGGRS